MLFLIENISKNLCTTSYNPVQPETMKHSSVQPSDRDPVQALVQPRTTQSMKLSIILRVVKGCPVQPPRTTPGSPRTTPG